MSKKAPAPAVAPEDEGSTEVTDIEKEAAQKAEGVVKVKPIRIRPMWVRIVGDGHLIVTRIAEKVKRTLRAKDTKEAKESKGPINPVVEFKNALDLFTSIDEKLLGKRPTLDDMKLLGDRAEEEFRLRQRLLAGGMSKAFLRSFRYGFPANTVRRALIEVCNKDTNGYFKTYVIQGLRIDANMLEIKGSIPIYHEDSVRTKSGTLQLAYRPHFFPWYMDVPIRYREDLLSAEQVVDLMEYAGFSNGLGCARIQKKDVHGGFHTERQSEAQVDRA